jgi:phosphatidylglycerol lysyltransferase
MLNACRQLFVPVLCSHMPKKIINYLHHAGKSYWREILAVLLLLLGIYFFRSQRHELLSLQEHLANSQSRWIIAGIAVTLFYILLQAAMYRSSFAAIGSSLQWSHGIDLFLKRNFLSVFLPAGGVSSLAYAPSYLRKNGISKIQTGQASAIYAFVGILTVFLIALPVLVVSIFQQERVANTLNGLVALSVFIAAMIWLVRSLQKKTWLYRQVNKKLPRLIPSIDQFFSIKISNRHGAVTVIYSLLIEVCGIAHIYIACKALGLPSSLEASAIAYVLSVLLMLFSPFLRGLGAVELAMVFVLQSFGFTAVNALAITVLYRFFEFWLPLVAGLFSFAWKGRYIFMRLFPAILVFLLGVVNILSVITPPIAERMKILSGFVPRGSINATNQFVLLTGFILLITSAYLIRGQRNAWFLAMILSVISLFGHLFKALDYEEAIIAASVLVILSVSAKQYRLKSNPKLVQLGLVSVLLVFAAIWIFGFVGFYFLEKRHFGFSFTTWQSLKLSAQNFILVGEDDLFPKTRFAHEFIGLMHTLGFIAWGFLAFVLVKPVLNRKKLLNTPAEKARILLERFGNSAVDYFKIDRDKLLFFSDQADGFISYRISNGFAIVLEGPVCAEDKQVVVLTEFDAHCRKMGLKTAFYRVDESSISFFQLLKKRKLLIGQEAILEIEKFSLEGRDKKSLRNALNSLQKKGFVTEAVKAPLTQELIAEMKLVSDDWLNGYHKKELVFSQGMFSNAIVDHDVIIMKDSEQNLKAFLDVIPDFSPGEITYDLIRKTMDAPGGCMDALIIELINYAKERGAKYVNLGLVPLMGIEEPDNTAEQLMSYAYRKLKRFRHYSGLRNFKQKYATTWHNKYLVYENDFDLLQLPMALNRVMQPKSLPK